MKKTLVAAALLSAALYDNMALANTHIANLSSVSQIGQVTSEVYVWTDNKPEESKDLHFNGKPITETGAVCFISHIGGQINGPDNWAHVAPHNGVWRLTVRGPKAFASARCLIF